MDIAQVSSELSQAKLQESVGAAVQSMAMKDASIQSDLLQKLMDSAVISDPEVGAIIDLKG